MKNTDFEFQQPLSNKDGHLFFDNFSVEQLIEEVRMKEGVHTIIFRAYNQPKGVYIANLKIRDKSGEKEITEHMTKAGPDTAELEQQPLNDE